MSPLKITDAIQISPNQWILREAMGDYVMTFDYSDVDPSQFDRCNFIDVVRFQNENVSFERASGEFLEQFAFAMGRWGYGYVAFIREICDHAADHQKHRIASGIYEPLDDDERWVSMNALRCIVMIRDIEELHVLLKTDITSVEAQIQKFDTTCSVANRTASLLGKLRQRSFRTCPRYRSR